MPLARSVPECDTTIPTARRAAIRQRLLAWYDRNKRDLPWRRRADDPYAQWVAEIMLQQTRVETVITFYERFLKRFPNLESLARAEHDAVLKYWEGMGYYRRILHLHEASKILAQRKQPVPDTVDGLRELPGIGEYTSAAIASIAFGKPVAAVDGNVVRVLSRLFHLAESPDRPASRKVIQSHADALLSRSRPGDFNQAWMDLGSSICIPGTPKCDACPLRTICASARGSPPKARPRGRGRVATNKVVNLVVGLFRQGDRLLVRRRARGGLWSGLWEFPSLVVDDVSSPNRFLRDLAQAEGLRIRGTGRRVGEVLHDLTHRRMIFNVFNIPVRGIPKDGETPTRDSPSEVHSTKPKGGRQAGKTWSGPDGQPRAWVNADEFATLSASTGHRRIWALDSGTRR